MYFLSLQEEDEEDDDDVPDLPGPPAPGIAPVDGTADDSSAENAADDSTNGKARNKTEVGGPEDDLTLRAALYGVLFQSYADKVPVVYMCSCMQAKFRLSLIVSGYQDLMRNSLSNCYPISTKNSQGP